MAGVGRMPTEYETVVEYNTMVEGRDYALIRTHRGLALVAENDGKKILIDNHWAEANGDHFALLAGANRDHFPFFGIPVGSNGDAFEVIVPTDRSEPAELRRYLAGSYTVMPIGAILRPIGTPSEASTLTPRRSHYIQIGDHELLFSNELQDLVVVLDSSGYESDRDILIVEEPPWHLTGHRNLLAGLAIFLDDNPDLQPTWLMEGLRTGKVLDIGPLVDAAPTPDDDLVNFCLGSFLITGAIAYEWVYQAGIRIEGTENQQLYDLCARLLSSPQKWPVTYVARNWAIAKSVIAALDRGQEPMLFVGGGHLHTTSGVNHEAQRRALIAAEDLSESVVHELEAARLGGIADYLREHRIGYVHIAARISASDQIEEERYNSLFGVQASGNYESYLDEYLGKVLGITVSPSPEAAASLMKKANRRSKNKKGEAKRRNKDAKNAEQRRVKAAAEAAGVRDFHGFTDYIHYVKEKDGLVGTDLLNAELRRLAREYAESEGR